MTENIGAPAGVPADLHETRLLIAYGAGLNAWATGARPVAWCSPVIRDLVANNPDKRIGASNAYFSAFTYGYCNAREAATSAGDNSQ